MYKFLVIIIIFFMLFKSTRTNILSNSDLITNYFITVR